MWPNIWWAKTKFWFHTYFSQLWQIMVWLILFLPKNNKSQKQVEPDNKVKNTQSDQSLFMYISDDLIFSSSCFQIELLKKLLLTIMFALVVMNIANHYSVVTNLGVKLGLRLFEKNVVSCFSEKFLNHIFLVKPRINFPKERHYVSLRMFCFDYFLILFKTHGSWKSHFYTDLDICGLLRVWLACVSILVFYQYWYTHILGILSSSILFFVLFI